MMSERRGVRDEEDKEEEVKKRENVEEEKRVGDAPMSHYISIAEGSTILAWGVVDMTFI